MGLCSSQSRSARIPQERSFSGYFWLTQRQEVQEILRESLAQETFGSRVAQETGPDWWGVCSYRLKARSHSVPLKGGFVTFYNQSQAEMSLVFHIVTLGEHAYDLGFPSLSDRHSLWDIMEAGRLGHLAWEDTWGVLYSRDPWSEASYVGEFLQTLLSGINVLWSEGFNMH